MVVIKATTYIKITSREKKAKLIKSLEIIN